MADADKSIYSLRYNQLTSNIEGFGGGSPQWTLLTLNNVDPQQVPITRQINTTAPLQGGGNLTVDRTLSIPQATGSIDGYLSATDWTTFNNKQSAGNYITVLTGDATAAGPGSVPLTLATVNGTVGTFTYASITVNAKGLVTSASSGVFGSLTDVGTDGITVTGGTGAVVGAGTSLSQHVADASHNGYLSQTDWSTFNSKLTSVLAGANIFVGNVSNVATAVALSGDATLANTGALTLATVNGNVGSFTNASITVNAKGLITAASSGTDNGITQLTGDVTAGPGSGSQAATLATVNANVGSFTHSSITVNAKGLITAASSGTAPVTSVSGTTNQITSTGGTTPVLALASPLIPPGTVTAGDGSVSAPEYSFSADTDNGLYRVGTNNPALAAGGTKVIDMKTTGVAILGTTANDNAATGNIGEYISSTVGTVTSAASAAFADLTSISLTAGDWDIYGIVVWGDNGDTWTQKLMGITSTTGNSGTGFTDGDTASHEQIASSSTSRPVISQSIRIRVSIASTTTYYLKWQNVFSAGTPATNGASIKARRAR